MSLIGMYLKKLFGGAIAVGEGYAAIVGRAFDKIDDAARTDLLSAEEYIEAIYQTALMDIEKAGQDVAHTKLWQAIENELSFRTVAAELNSGAGGGTGQGAAAAAPAPAAGTMAAALNNDGADGAQPVNEPEPHPEAAGGGASGP